MNRRKTLGHLALALLAAAPAWLCGVAAAADLGPLRIVWPYPAGGDVDGVLRLMAETMAADAGRTVLVENRTGATGLIAMQAVATAPADGNTLLAVPVSAVALLPHTKKMPLEPLKTFVPVCQFADTSSYVIVGKHLGFRNFGELVAYARAHPGKLSYASSGVGTAVHLLGEMLQRSLGIKLLHVPYQGPLPAITDIIAGRLDMMFEPAALPYVRSGKMDVLGVLTERKPADMPDLPTAKELGIDTPPSSWFGFFVRKETPAPDIARLEKTCSQAMANPALLARWKNFQAQPVYRPAAELARMWKADDALYAELIRSLNIKLDN